MLDALRRLGKPVPLAVLSAATLAAGAQSVNITPGSTNLGIIHTLQYTATGPALTNKTVTWLVNGVKSGNATISSALQNYSLFAQNRRGWPFPRTRCFPSTTAMTSMGCVQASPNCKASAIRASLPSTNAGNLVQPINDDGYNATNLAIIPAKLFATPARPGSSRVPSPLA